MDIKNKFIKNKDMPYNFNKSIKDKEKIVLDYYKKLTSREQPKPIIAHKQKKRTLKKIPKTEESGGITNTDDGNTNKKDDKMIKENEENEKYKENKEKKEIANKKLTQKRIVIMDD